MCFGAIIAELVVFIGNAHDQSHEKPPRLYKLSAVHAVHSNLEEQSGHPYSVGVAKSTGCEIWN